MVSRSTGAHHLPEIWVTSEVRAALAALAVCVEVSRQRDHSSTILGPGFSHSSV